MNSKLVIYDKKNINGYRVLVFLLSLYNFSNDNKFHKRSPRDAIFPIIS